MAGHELNVSDAMARRAFCNGTCVAVAVLRKTARGELSSEPPSLNAILIVGVRRQVRWVAMGLCK
jgi:hypothetical protein